MQLNSYTASGKIGKTRHLLAPDAHVISGELSFKDGTRKTATLSDGANRITVTRVEYEKLRDWFEGKPKT